MSDDTGQRGAIVLSAGRGVCKRKKENANAMSPM